MEKINFYEKYLEFDKEGSVLFGYPVDETAIRAYNITEEEMEPYMNEPKWRDVHWFDILKDILNKRKSMA